MWDKKIKPRPSKTTISKQEEFEEIMGMTTEEAAVRAQLQSQEGITFVAQYRNYLQADFYLYKNIQGQWNNYGQIGDTILHNKVMALLAREYQIKPQAFFQYLEYADKDACTFLNAAYQEDFSDDNLEIVSFYSKWYKYLFGVGIKARIGWDGDKKSNIFQYVDPRIWVPDPDGDYASGDYAYTGFEKMYDEANLYGQGWLNMDKIIPMQFSAYSQQLQKYKDQQLDYLPNMGTNPVTNAWYDIYLHYGKAQDKQGIERKYRIILGNDRKLPLFIELLPATCEAQKKNPSLISFPFAFEYWNPEPNNPFGNRPANYIRNVEEAKRLLMTLQLKKVKAELYPMYFYNEKYIGNKSDLQFGFNKFIGVNTEDDGPVPLDNIITAFRPDSSSGNTMQINQMLDQQVDRSTFMSDNQLGQQATGDPSATQTNVVQTNSDLNLALPAKISTWGAKAEMRIWLDGYLENFAEGDKKFITLAPGTGDVPITLTKKQFLIGLRVKVIVISSTDVEAKKQKEALALNVLATWVQSANLPDISKMIMLREVAASNGMEEMKINVIMPKSPQERLATIENGILLKGGIKKVLPSDDDVTHMIVHGAAGSGVETTLHTMAHIQQYIAKGQPQVSTANPQIQNAMASSQAGQLAGAQTQAQLPSAQSAGNIQ